MTEITRTTHIHRSAPVSWRGRAILAAILVLWWLLLSGAAAESWVVGVPSLVLALWLHARLGGSGSPPTRWRPRVLPGFAVWFLRQSLRGGVDVARRTLSPRMPLSPGFVHLPLRIPPGPARTFLMNCISLMPGTLSADLEHEDLVIHALDVHMGLSENARDAERRVAALFGLTLGDVPR